MPQVGTWLGSVSRYAEPMDAQAPLPEVIEVGADLAELVGRLRSRLPPRGGRLMGGRLMVGLTGAPGVGKSTVAEALGRELGPRLAVTVPMDGFHIATAALAPGQLERRGAIDTFDAGGFVSLLQRLRRNDESVVYAPGFERTLEEPIAGILPIARDVPIVITEGNYLLSTEPDWHDVRGLLDEVWFLEENAEVRLTRLIARHIRFGKTPEHARFIAEGSDERNAREIENHRSAADLVVRFTTH